MDTADLWLIIGWYQYCIILVLVPITVVGPTGINTRYLLLPGTSSTGTSGKPSPRGLMCCLREKIHDCWYANECTHSFARLRHSALAIAVGRTGDFLAFSRFSPILLPFSRFSPIFLPFSPCEKILLRFSQFSLEARKFLSASPYVRNFFSHE